MRNFSVDEVGRYLSSGYWATIGATAPTLDGTISVNILSLSPANQNLVRLALKAWSDLGFTFNFTGSNAADILFSDDYRGAFTSWSERGGKPLVNIGPDFSSASGSGLGSYTYQSWLHEIGHALGLGHTGAYNGTGTYGVDNLFANDSWQMSVMSYFPQDENTSINASFAYVMTPMPGDIAAIDMLYDLTPKAGQGNTVYFWGTNASGIHGVIGRQIQNGTLTAPVTMTIMDVSGNDTLNFSGSNQSVRVNLAPGSINSAFGLKNNILIERSTVIESVIGSSARDVITGQFAHNVLNGGAGNDDLLGANGNDTLLGGPGNDRLLGGNGNDVLRGHGGADIINGGVGFDTVIYDNAPTRVDLVTPNRNSGSAAGDLLIGVERINGGTAADEFSGDNGNNILSGGGAGDWLHGRGGNDTLLGGSGNDTLVGGDGHDQMIGGAGADVMRGDAGRDLVIYSSGAVVVDLVVQALNGGDARGDLLWSIENISGSVYNDRLVGNAVANTLLGNNGHDILNGRQGDDRLDGGNGNDILIAGSGNDTVIGGNGGDQLISHDGDNLLIGGPGADEFVFAGGHANVADFQDDVDELVIRRGDLGLNGARLADILDMAKIVQGNTHIDLGGGDYIFVRGVDNLNDLADDIVLI